MSKISISIYKISINKKGNTSDNVDLDDFENGNDLLDIIKSLPSEFIKITNKEIDLMNSTLPRPKSRFLNLKKIDFIPQNCREAYYDFYKYHPSYFEIID